MSGNYITHYRILRTLGEGGMGVVYEAEDTRLNRRVAIKMPKDKLAGHPARFQREAQAIAALSHPNIATLYDYGATDDGKPFMVMELVSGLTLTELIKAGLLLPRAVEIVQDVAAALQEAHRHNIIHRDIKPSNIVVNQAGVVKLLDFGLVKRLLQEERQSDSEADTALVTQTRNNAVLGTPLYLSPEQARSIEVDARSDIFALGAVLYECLTGRPAFAAGSALEIIGQVLHVNPPPPSVFHPGIPPALDAIVLRALAKDPRQRYQSATEMQAALKDVQAQLETSELATQIILTAPETPPPPSLFAVLSQALHLPRFSASLAAVGLVVASAFGLLLWQARSWLAVRPHQPPPQAQKWYDDGLKAYRNGAWYRAGLNFQEAVKADPNFALARVRLVEVYLELDDYQKASQELGQTLGLRERLRLAPAEELSLRAVSALAGRDFARAAEHYRELARLTPGAATAFDLGRALEKNDDVDKAIEQYQLARQDPLCEASAQLRLGVLYHERKDDSKAARQAFDEAERLDVLAGDADGRAAVCYERGVFLNDTGDAKAARQYLQTSLQLMASAGGAKESVAPQQIKARLQLGYSYFAENKELARQEITQAVVLAKQNGLANLAAQGLLDEGNIHLAGGVYDQAEASFRQALDEAQKNEWRFTAARAQLSLASLREQQNKPDEALNYLQMAYAFFQKEYPKQLSQAQNLRGRLNLIKGEYAAATQDFLALLPRAEAAGDNERLITLQGDIGDAYLRQENYPAALPYLTQSSARAASLGQRLNQGYYLLARGWGLGRLGRFAEAQADLQQAQAIAAAPGGNEPPDARLSVNATLVAAHLALSRRDWPAAIAESRKVLAESQETEAIDAKSILCVAQTFSGQKAAGLQSCDEAVKRAEQSADTSLLSQTLLYAAQARRETGDDNQSRAQAETAQARLARAGQQDSEWRAWLLVGLAQLRVGDTAQARASLAHAREQLEDLRQKWGATDYQSYLQRPDVQFYRQQLEQPTP